MRKALLLVFVVTVLMTIFGGCTGQQPTEESKNTVAIVQANPPDMSKKLAAGEIDGFIAWEPFNAQAVVNSQSRYLVQSAEIWPGHPCCVLAAAESLNDPSVLCALVWSHIKATNFINNPSNREKVLQYTQEFTGQNPSVAAEALSHVKFVSSFNKDQFRVYYMNLKESGILKKTFSELGYKSEDHLMRDFIAADTYESVRASLVQDPGWVPAAVPEGVKITMGYLSRDLHELAVYVAQKEGYFKAVGLEQGKNLEIKEYANGVAVMEAFKAKDLNVSYLGGAPATMKRINDNIKIKVIAAANDEGSAIVVGKDSQVKSVKDLAGKVVAVPAVGTVQYFVLDMALKKDRLRSVLR
jgi:NitT/TauT family transport system substrate-binding protein